MQAAGGASLNQAGAGSDIRAGGASRGRIVALACVAASVLLLDQVSKMVAVRELDGGSPVEALGGVLVLRLVRNPGAAFGLAGGATALISLIALAVVVVIARTARRLRSTGWAVALGLLLGGAVGNLTDRVLREPAPLRGRVIDFLQVPRIELFQVFNLADVAISCGTVLVLLLTLRGIAPEGRRPPPDHDG